MSPYSHRLAEEFALFSSLDEYPRDKSFDEVVALIEAGDETIVSIDHLGSLDADGLIDHLRETRRMAYLHFGPAADLVVEVSKLKLPTWGDHLGNEIYREQSGLLIHNAAKLVVVHPTVKKSEQVEASAQHSSQGVSP
jgi:hypothetical protein